MQTSVRAPARIGATIEVSARDLFAADPHWRTAGRDGALHMAIRYRSKPIDCTVHGGDDGVLDAGDVVTFKVGQTNRHSPYLVYQVVHPRSGSGTLCKLESTAGVHTSANRETGVVLPRHPATRDEPPVDVFTWDRWRHADYLILAPGEWLGSLSELIAHRERTGHTVAALAVEDVYDRFSQGNPDPTALHQAISLFARRSRGRLRYVLLVGDVEAKYAPAVTGPTPVPTFYRKKVHYPGYVAEQEYPTDHPYGVVTNQAAGDQRQPAASIAVGRLPARDSAQVEMFARKVVAYERRDDEGGWQRKLVVYGGPANYGRLADGIIENIASYIMNDLIPYDYDVQVVFAKADSPYAYRFDKLGPQLVSDLNAGALFAAYFGHGLANAFDHVAYRNEYYQYGHADDLRHVKIGPGKPVFLSFSCNTGAYDRPKGKASLAEVLGLSPTGPIAIWSSSRSSHPYPNALYARAFVDVFLDGRPPTLGDGLIEIKRQLRDRRIVLAETLVGQDVQELKDEHEGLYNLLGDPALRLRYPEPLQVSVDPSAQTGGKIAVRVASRTPTDGHVTITLETERRAIRGKLVSPGRLAKMSVGRAFSAMAANHRKAIDKVVLRRKVALHNGVAEVVLEAPRTPGAYVVKALAATGQTAAGHAKVSVISTKVAAR